MRTLKEKMERRLFLMALSRMRTDFERKMAKDFDPELSRQLDCCQFLIESFGGRSSDLSGGALTTPGPANLRQGGEKWYHHRMN